MLSGLWGPKAREWPARDVVGNSGGILTIWKKDSDCPLFSFTGKGFLCLKALWKGIIIYFINIYSPCNLEEKMELWRELLECKT